MKNVGIGFATGRRNFKRVARTYAENWHESGITSDENIRLHLFVAYDLKYKNTKPKDYRNLDQRILDMLEFPFFIGDNTIKQEANMLVKDGIISEYEAELLFGEGYGKKRNAIMFFAIKNRMDYLLYVDDDEYPIAAINTPDGLVWKGQPVLATHLKHIGKAGITHGYHCGYVSPIPQIAFNNDLKEENFRLFIETISNDIINWDSIKQKMLNGGLTYCDEMMLKEKKCIEVPEINNAKFISGSNVFFNLNSSSIDYPFYNPPGARGEDTFMSTCLSDIKVIKVPTCAFHDGFSTYSHLLYGALPTKLKPIITGEKEINNRFFRACIGWIRYKPLYLYITNQQGYKTEIEQMIANLNKVLPKVCSYFHTNDFMRLTKELAIYSQDVQKHYIMFEETKAAWQKVIMYMKNQSK